MNNLVHFISGVAMLGAFVGGVHFFRFWIKSKDRLFLMFGISFWLMSLERLVLALNFGLMSEEYSYFYLIRLIAFLIIIVAIVDKNRNTSGSV